MPHQGTLRSFNSSVEMETSVVSFKLRSADTAHTCEATDAFVVPEINLSTRKINWTESKYQWPYLASLDLPAIDSSKVEILLGMDVTAAQNTIQVIEPPAGEEGPTAHRTPFGFSIVGKIPKSLVTGPSIKGSVNLQSMLPPLSRMMDRSHLPSPSNLTRSFLKRSPRSEEDEKMLGIMKNSITFIGCVEY